MRRLVLIALFAATACGGGAGGSFQRSTTSTVTIGNERTLLVNVPVAIQVVGNPLKDVITAELDVTITASTATRARIVAEMIAFDLNRTEEKISLSFTAPKDAGISGVLELSMPPHLELELLSAGTIEVSRMNAPMSLNALSSVKVTDAKASVKAEVRAGNLLIDADAPQGTLIDAKTGSGDIELKLFERPSLDLDATVSGQGEVLIAHPAFPPVLGHTSRYQARVNGGLAVARLLTSAGRIVIRAR